MNVASMRHATCPVGAGHELPGLLLLSATMSDCSHEDGVLALVGCAVPAWTCCDLVAGYLLRDGKPERLPVGWLPPDERLDERVAALNGTDAQVSLPDRVWAAALALRGPGGAHGYLVVSARSAPAPHEVFLLRLLVRQAGMAVAGVAARRGERELRSLREKLDEANDRLTATIAEHERRATVQRTLAKGGGEQAIADALHALTGLAVAIEDPFGNLRLWSGPGLPERYSRPDTERREETLRQAARLGGPVRDGDRVVAVARRRHEILGSMVLIGSECEVGPEEVFALEQGAAVLGLELAHRRDLAEVESRLRGGLVNDLVTDGDPVRSYARSEAVGHDLHGLHQVMVIRWPGVPDLIGTVARAAGAVGMRYLAGQRADTAVLVATSPLPARELYELLRRELGTPGAIGVGGRADSPARLPRSFHEASQALEIRHPSDGVVVFEDLGLYRILHAGQDGVQIERYVREWLGPLLDYDSRHHTELTNTLFQYLECGGNYASTADALVIHRSTLRYRLRRIRDVGEIDLRDVDSRLNLHVAARAWHMHTTRSV